MQTLSLYVQYADTAVKIEWKSTLDLFFNDENETAFAGNMTLLFIELMDSNTVKSQFNESARFVP